MVTTEMQPSSIGFMLTNSVNSLTKNISQVELDNCTLINITLITLVLKKFLGRNTSKENIDMITYLNKINGIYDKKQIEKIVEKLNNWDEIPNDNKTNLVAWCRFMNGDIRARIIIEAPSLGYMTNIPSLFYNVLKDPKIEFSPTSPYYNDYNKLSDYVERKTLNEMSRQS